MKFKSLIELYDFLPEGERMLTDVLRSIVRSKVSPIIKEKLSHSVPYFYGNKGICIIWPASIKGGGIREGVLLGFMQGNKLDDTENYLTKGTNKKIYYKIYTSPDQINKCAIDRLLEDALRIDLG